MSQAKKNSGFNADFDTFWKEILDLIEPAVAFFLPDLHADVDWSVEYTSLEQELRGMFGGKKSRLKRTDKLFRLKLKDGDERYLFLHVEAEAFPKINFPTRIFGYHTHLYVKFESASIVILVVFVGNPPSMPLNIYTSGHYGTKIHLEYTTYTVAEQSEQVLMASDNPFALAVLANLYVIQSRGDVKMRLALKRKLVEHLISKQISLDKFRNVLKFAFYFVRLPDKEEDEVLEFLENYKIKEDMTGKQKAMEYNRGFIDALSKAWNGESVSDVYKKNEILEREKNEIIRSYVLHLFKNGGQSPEQISADLKLELSLVLDIIKNTK